MVAIISFVSQKGGVGKTTCAINLATAFAFGGYSVLLLDLDPQSSIRFSMGVNNTVPAGTKELFLNTNTPVSQLTQHTGQENLDFIFSNLETIESEKAVFKVGDNARFLRDRLVNECNNYDFIVIDAPSATNNMAINAMYCADLIIIPLQCESLAIKSLKRFLKSFNELQNKLPDRDFRIAGILLTMYDRRVELHRKVGKQVYRTLSDSVFQTIIPRNEAIIEASALGKSVITYRLNSIGATAYIRLMNELVDKFSLR